MGYRGYEISSPSIREEAGRRDHVNSGTDDRPGTQFDSASISTCAERSLQNLDVSAIDIPPSDFEQYAPQITLPSLLRTNRRGGPRFFRARKPGHRSSDIPGCHWRHKN